MRALVLLFVLLLLSGAWLGFRALQVRGALQEAQSVLTSAVDGAAGGDVEALRGAQRSASADVETARRAVDDPLWRVAGFVPVAGRSFTVTRDATLVVEQVVDGVLPPLLDSGSALKQRDLLSNGRVDLALLGTLVSGVDQAERAARGAQRDSQRIRGGFLPGAIAEGRAELVTGVDRLAASMATARAVLDLAPAMLGSQEPRRYFLAVQNNTEVRGTGGLVGAYAILRAEQGQLSLERAGTNSDFQNFVPAQPAVDLGPEFADLYDRFLSRRFWPAAVITPDWPSASAIMAALWEKQGGGRIDGVVGVDPLAMAEILAVTGPAQLSGQTIGADNVVDFIMRDEYALFANDNEARKEVLGALATVLYQKVSAGGFATEDMAKALGRAGGSGHLQIWQSRGAEQAVLGSLRAAGALPDKPGAYLQVVSNNGAANKMDYYIRRKVSYVRTAPGKATVTVELTNTLSEDVPRVVTFREDKPPYAVEPRQTRQLLGIYVGQGQEVGRVSVDGQEQGPYRGSEKGHGVAIVPVEIRTSRPTVIVAEVSDPGGILTYRQQPLVVPDTLELSLPTVIR